jgi:hypothetical protein
MNGSGHRDYLEGTVTDHAAFAAKAERVITTGRTPKGQPSSLVQLCGPALLVTQCHKPT